MKTPFRFLPFAPLLAVASVVSFATFAQDAQKPEPVSPPPAPPPAVAPAEPPAPPVDVEKKDDNRKAARRVRVTHSSDNDIPFGDHLVGKGKVVRESVSILGATTVEGEVQTGAVSVLGSTTVGPEGKVDGATVAVLGRLEVLGEVSGEAVCVLGEAFVNGSVGRKLVSVLGDVHLGPKAVINGDVVIVGGKLTRDPGAVVHGRVTHPVVFGSVGSIEPLTTWIKECLLKGRPLAFEPQLGWAWAVALAFFALYLLLALLFAGGIEKCLTTFETRPGSSILAAALTVLLSPVAMVLLAITVVGALLVPFLAMGLFVAGLFGKAVILAWIGRRFTKFYGEGPLNHPVFAVLVGGAIVLLLYTVWGSFLLYKLLSWLGVGVVVYTIALAMKREKPVAPASAAPIPPFAQPVPVAPVVPPVASTAMMSAGFTGVTTGMGDSTPFAGPVGNVVPPSVPVEPPPGPAPSTPPVMPSAIRPAPMMAMGTLPRAGFSIRLAAMAIDGVLIGMLLGFSTGLLPRFLHFNHGTSGFLLALAIYAAVMWKNKGTTIGGIVCGLKVVRLDHRELDWATAIVRAVSCFLSLFVAGLGFFWVAFDDERQSWHDKIAGTTVVRVPKGVSLL